jgi:DNA mismatch repair protein MutL
MLDELVELGVRERAIAGGAAEPGGEVRRRIFRLSGFISRPQIQKLNRNSIFLFVNRRLIRDRLLLHAISAAYHNLMPPACFPFALLFLDCDYEEVDVNVHPSKTEVRFRAQSLVHDFVRDALREALIESKPAGRFRCRCRARRRSRRPSCPTRSSRSSWSRASWGASAMPAGEAGRPARGAAGVHAARHAAGRAAVRFRRRLDCAGRAGRRAAARRSDSRDARRVSAELVPEPSQSLTALADLRPLGQIHESFIVAAGRDGLWIIDQHVAHERILFEKILKERAAGRAEMQRLLMPLIVQLTPGQQVDYDRIADELQASGFETEPFGQRTIAVKGAPAGVRPGEIERLIGEILEIAERELRKVSMDQVRRAIAASIACHAAIKVNMRLDADKMGWLLKSLAATECPMSCPHGRPIALRYSLRDILKGFHRI